MMDWHKQNLKDQEERQREMNNMRRNANKAGINQHKNIVLT